MKTKINSHINIKVEILHFVLPIVQYLIDILFIFIWSYISEDKEPCFI